MTDNSKKSQTVTNVTRTLAKIFSDFVSLHIQFAGKVGDNMGLVAFVGLIVLCLVGVPYLFDVLF